MTHCAGVDEAGRGPLAGPVVAAAVILDAARPVKGLADSKMLSRASRERIAVEIRRNALAYGIGFADNAEIDALNILQATFLAMRRALFALAVKPAGVAIDGNRLPQLADFDFKMGARAIIRGDATVPAISAASILAKTARDFYMDQMDTLYPCYEFRAHKGYPTPGHLRALASHGPTPLHRRSFAPVQSAL
jgi:ribonuclease HII